jgi:nitronate monooxygenase
MNGVMRSLDLVVPIIQAPMAGVSTPALAAAVAEAGGLGGVAVGAVDAATARGLIAAVRALTTRPFVVNVFCHRPPVRDAARDAAWLAALAPAFARYGAVTPDHLVDLYPSFLDDDAMLATLISDRPPAVSFHFGLPAPAAIAALRAAGCVLMATATSLAEALAIEAAGLDVVIAQGIEAGGHRGTFDENAPDAALSTAVLTRLLVRGCRLPVIAAGGIMDGAGIAACMALGAAAAQLGTAFVACPESSADPAHRAALLGPGGAQTTMTRAMSGRPARSVGNVLTALPVPPIEIPPYPLAYAATKALAAAARAAGETGLAPQLAGQGAPLARALPAAELVAILEAERRAAVQVEASEATSSSS